MRRVALTRYISPSDINADDGEGYFHQFVVEGDSEQGTETLAVIERDDGRVARYEIERVRFLEPPVKPLENQS